MYSILPGALESWGRLSF